MILNICQYFSHLFDIPWKFTTRVIYLWNENYKNFFGYPYGWRRGETLVGLFIDFKENKVKYSFFYNPSRRCESKYSKISHDESHNRYHPLCSLPFHAIIDKRQEGFLKALLLDIMYLNSMVDWKRNIREWKFEMENANWYYVIACSWHEIYWYHPESWNSEHCILELPLKTQKMM